MNTLTIEQMKSLVEALQQSIEKATVASSRIQRIKERGAEFIS